VLVVQATNDLKLLRSHADYGLATTPASSTDRENR
jgi:hypothetical protein